ncbi:hypothetical protein D1007_38500 [Hordeum vulgare]|nr:hypothetical protein D1007_38500 [Hordeum vulgare]
MSNLQALHRLRCACGRQCAKRKGSSVAKREKFFLRCINYNVPGARFCEAYIWEEDLDRYTNQFCQTAVDLANYHKNRHESCEEKLDEVHEQLEEANAEIRRLKWMNKAIQMALAATAPVAPILAESDEDDMDVFDAYPTTEVCQEEAESDSEGCGKGNRKGGVCPINSRGSVKRFKKLNDLLSEEKRRLVEEMKLGGLMHIPKITRTNRRDTPFDDKDVDKVLGVPGEGATINKNQAPHVLSSVRQTLGISSSETRISVIEEIVKKEYGRKMTKAESDAFKVAYVVCAVTYVLAPPLKHNYFMTDYWGGLHTPGLIHMYNWGKYVLEEVLISAGRVKSELLGGKVKSNLSGCTFFMQIASILVEKVGHYSSRCKAVLQLASKKGGDVSAEDSGEESPLSPCSAMCNTKTNTFDEDPGNVSHKSDVNQMGCSTKRKRVEEASEEADPAIRNLDELIAAAEQYNPVNNDREVHEQMPIQAQSADGRKWIYGPHSSLNTEVPSFDLGVENDEAVQVPSRELTILATTQQEEHTEQYTKQGGPSKFKIDFTGFRSIDLMDDFSRAVTPHGSGLEMVCTPAHHSIPPNRAAGTTPISLNREIAAQELDIREEMEQATINLNVTHTQDGLSTQPHRKRTVKPGRAARSPFVLGYDPPTRAPANVEKVFRMFMKESVDARKDNWVISTQPKYVELTADHIRMSLSEGGVIENDLMIVAIRRYQQMDYVFALDKDEGCWRHWLEPDFVNHVSRGDVIVRYVQDMFIREHINYDVHRCTEFILPVKFNFTWSTYIWDFPKKRIIVLDPTINNGNESDKVIQNRHRKVADNLHVALQSCIQEFFQGWAPDMARWNTIFPKWLNVGLCTGPDSGVYALHYGRNWMGSKFKRVLNPQNDGVVHSRMNILVDVLGLEGNIGHMPERYRNFLVRKKEKEHEQIGLDIISVYAACYPGVQARESPF